MRSRNLLTTGATNSQPAKLPAIILPNNLDPALHRALEAIKERLEVREGTRGNPYERATTLRDVQSVEDARIVERETRSTDPATSARLVSKADITREVNRAESSLRTEIQRVDRSLQSSITSLVGRWRNEDGLSALEAMAFSAASRYTQEMLADDLAAGAAKVFAGAVSGAAVMELAPDGSYVLFKHKDANINGLGAGYSGIVRTALGITAAGLVAGFNRPDTGAWQNSIVIDSATGDVTILGTLKAGSVIQTGALIGTGGMTMQQLLTDVSNAAADAAAAEAEALSASSLAATKLNADAADILTGEISFSDDGSIKAGSVSVSSTGVVSGTGVAITQQGLVGVKAGVPTFTITTSGDATFSGDVVTGGDAQFSGNKTSTRTINITGANYSVDYSAWADATTSASSGSVVRAGLIGFAGATTSAFNVGVIGRAPSTTKGIGVVGDGGFIGGYFSTNSSSGNAIECVNTSGNTALYASGSITATGNITAYSDRRLKRDFEAIDSPLQKVQRLTGYTFTRVDTGQRQTGLIAQDVQDVMPEAVVEQQDGHLSVAYGNLVGLLVEAVKELDRRTAA